MSGVFGGSRRLSGLFGGLRRLFGGPRRLPRGSRKSLEIFEFSSIFRRLIVEVRGFVWSPAQMIDDDDDGGDRRRRRRRLRSTTTTIGGDNDRRRRRSATTTTTTAKIDDDDGGGGDDDGPSAPLDRSKGRLLIPEPGPLFRGFFEALCGGLWGPSSGPRGPRERAHGAESISETGPRDSRDPHEPDVLAPRNVGHPRGREDKCASRFAASAGELPFSKAASRGSEDDRASRIAGRDTRSWAT